MSVTRKEKLWLALLTAILIPFYLILTVYWPLWVRIFLILPVASLFYFLSLTVFGYIGNRVRAKDLKITELILLVVFIILPLIDSGRFSLLFWLMVLILATGLFLFRRKAAFRTVLTGAVIYGLVFASFRLLQLEQQLIFAAYRIYKTGEFEEQLNSRYLVEKQSGRTWTLKNENQTFFQFQIPKQSHLFKADEELRKELSGGPGLPVFVLSNSSSDPAEPPVAVLFETPKEQTVTELEQRVSFMLGGLGLSSRIGSLKKEKDQTIQPPDYPVTMNGSFWTYNDRFYASDMRTGFFLFELRDRRFLLWIREPVEPGFPFHPRTLSFLRSLSL